MSEYLEYVLTSPESPLDAAQQFFEQSLPNLRETLSPDFAALIGREVALKAITIQFIDAGQAHRGWRLAVVQDLAREMAPVRVNAVFGDDLDTIREATAYLRDAPGITGQLLAVDGNAAEKG